MNISFFLTLTILKNKLANVTNSGSGNSTPVLPLTFKSFKNHLQKKSEGEFLKDLKDK